MAPVVVLLGSTAPQPRSLNAEPPLALQSINGKLLVEHWWDCLVAAKWDSPADIYVATNAMYYKYFEHWSFGKGLELLHIINSGRSLGDARVDWRTLSIILRSIAKTQPGKDVVVIAADSAPAQNGPAFAAVLQQLAAADSTSIALRPGQAPGSGPSITATVAGTTVQSITCSTSTTPRASATHTAPVLFCLKAADVAKVLTADAEAGITALAGSAQATDASAGVAAERVIPVECVPAYLAQSGSTVTGVELPSSFVVGAFDGSAHGIPADAAASAVASSVYTHSSPRPVAAADSTIHTRAYARVGLMGNPSDGYGGKTLAVTIENFRAEAWLTPNARPDDASVTLVPHPIYDPLHFPNLRHISTIAGREGYSGGIRLMMASLHRFYQYCTKRGIELPTRGFSVRYHTTVPRQVGLAGSSAIITAFLRAVMRFYGYGDEASASSIGLSRDTLPAFVLAIESEELGITAGLQDRVVQAYEGCVHMDFNGEKIKEQGHGTYTRVPVHALPPLFLAYCADPSDSGRIHAPVKQRWLAGDKEVVDGMNKIASLADDAFAVASARPYSSAADVAGKEGVVHEWAALMASNFNNRRALFGDPALGKDNIRMIEIARECGSSGKFPGSGGAILGVVDVAGIDAAGRLPAGTPSAPDATASTAVQAEVAAARVAAATDILRAAYHAEGYVFIRLQPHEAPAEGAGYVVE